MDYRKEAIECVRDLVLPLHKQIYAKYNGDFDKIYSEGYNSKSYQGKVIEPGKVYELSYSECSCPKVKCGLRSNPDQCECSRQSILYILSQLEPDSQFDVFRAFLVAVLVFAVLIGLLDAVLPDFSFQLNR